MEVLRAYIETKEQSDALQAALKAMQVDFEIYPDKLISGCGHHWMKQRIINGRLIPE